MNISAVQQITWSYVLDEPTRILVVDDDPIFCEFASVHLSSPAAAIEIAADGASALTLLNGGNQFDIVLIDIAMPPPDGFALLERIRAEPKLRHMPVVMLTGLEDIASIDRAFSLGANSFVTKPVNWRLLNYHVRCVLRSSKAEQELRRAQQDAETREAAYNRSLLAFEMECRAVLRSILQHSDGGDGPLRSDAPLARLRQIEELAAAALVRWDEVSGKPAVSDKMAAHPGADELKLGEPGRC